MFRPQRWQTTTLPRDSGVRLRYGSGVLLPFDRARLRERNDADMVAERLAAADRSPEEGLRDAVELSEVVRSLALATSGGQGTVDDLAAKARLYVLPLRAAQRS
jgi:hypothetical protein